MAKSNRPKKVAGTKSAKTNSRSPNGKPKPTKPTKPARKPVKYEQTAVQNLGRPANGPIARPRITDPDANSDVSEDNDLNVTGTVNVMTVTYRLELLLNGVVVDHWDADPDDATGTVEFLIPSGTLVDGEIYELRLRVHPDDAADGDLVHTITITTTNT